MAVIQSQIAASCFAASAFRRELHCPICADVTTQTSSVNALCCLQSENMEHRHKRQKQTSLLQLWARAPAKQIQTVSRSSDELQVTLRRNSFVSAPMLCLPECTYAALFVTVLSLPLLLLLLLLLLAYMDCCL